MDKEDAAPAKLARRAVQRERKPSDPSQFGRIFKPDQAWLAKAAARADPRARPRRSSTPTIICGTCRAIAICCTTCWPTSAPATRWSPPSSTNATRCTAPRGPVEMKPVGEVEFCAGVAAMSDSGSYGPTRVCAGIVGHADLALGDRVAPVLEAEIAAGGGRFRASAIGAAWDDDPVIGNSHVARGPGVHRSGRISAPAWRGWRRSACRSMPGSSITQIAEVTDLARAFPEATSCSATWAAPLGYGPYAGRQEGRVFAAWKAAMTELAKLPQRVGEARRPDDAAGRHRLHARCRRRRRRQQLADALAALRRDLHRAVRRRPLHGREQLPGREDGHRLCRHC